MNNTIFTFEKQVKLLTTLKLSTNNNYNNLSLKPTKFLLHNIANRQTRIKIDQNKFYLIISLKLYYTELNNVSFN